MSKKEKTCNCENKEKELNEECVCEHEHCCCESENECSCDEDCGCSKEEETYLLSPEERGMLQSNRSLQLNEIKTLLAIQDEEKSNEEIEYLIREYCRKAFGVEDPDFKTAILYGIGSDGTVGAVKNIVKIVGGGKRFQP